MREEKRGRKEIKGSERREGKKKKARRMEHEEEKERRRKQETEWKVFKEEGGRVSQR